MGDTRTLSPAVRKRQRIRYSHQAKADALARLCRGDPVRDVAADLGACVATVNRWKSLGVPRLVRSPHQDPSPPSSITTPSPRPGPASSPRDVSSPMNIRPAAALSSLPADADDADVGEVTHPMLDALLLDWIAINARLHGCVSNWSRSLICAEARRINERLGGPKTFNAMSSDWFEKFAARHKLRDKRLQSLSEDVRAAETFACDLREAMLDGGYDHRDVYNVDEVGLCYKALPTTEGAKELEERLTLRVCANAVGTHKIPLLVIGKSKRPKCFRNGAEVLQLPVKYVSGRGASMDRNVFLDWFVDVFIPSVEERQRLEQRRAPVLLLTDGAPCHALELESQLIHGRFQIKVAPSELTAFVQPLDQGVLGKLKRLYRRILLNRLEESDVAINSFYESITVKEACLMAAEAWAAVPEECIRRAWRELIPEVDERDPIACDAEDPDIPSRPDTPLEEHIAQVCAPLRRAKITDLSDADLRLWFAEVHRAEDSVEQPEPAALSDSSSEEEEEEEEDGARVQLLAAWRLVKRHMLHARGRGFTVADIVSELADPDEVPDDVMYSDGLSN